MVNSLYGIEEAVNALWVFLEHSGGVLETVSLELLGKARELADTAGWPVVGLLLGADVGDLAQTACAHGANAVQLAEHPLLAEFTVEGYTHVAGEALLAAKPTAFLLGATLNGRDLAGRLAVRLRSDLVDCVAELQLTTGLEPKDAPAAEPEEEILERNPQSMLRASL